MWVTHKQDHSEGKMDGTPPPAIGNKSVKSSPVSNY